MGSHEGSTRHKQQGPQCPESGEDCPKEYRVALCPRTRHSRDVGRPSIEWALDWTEPRVDLGAIDKESVTYEPIACTLS